MAGRSLILECPRFKVSDLNWISGVLREFDAVRTLGFAFGLDLDEQSVTSRAFTGW